MGWIKTKQQRITFLFIPTTVVRMYHLLIWPQTLEGGRVGVGEWLGLSYSRNRYSVLWLYPMYFWKLPKYSHSSLFLWPTDHNGRSNKSAADAHWSYPQSWWWPLISLSIVLVSKKLIVILGVLFSHGAVENANTCCWRNLKILTPLCSLKVV